MGRLALLLGEDKLSLGELQELQLDLYRLIARQHGASAAAAVLGQALAAGAASDALPAPAATLADGAGTAPAPSADGAGTAPAPSADGAGTAPAPSADGADGTGGAGTGIRVSLLDRLVSGDWGPERVNSGATDVSDDTDSQISGSSVHPRWHKAIQLSAHGIDPWTARNIHSLPMERATRHRYNGASASWVEDEVLVKMEGRPFAAGAMRECFAMKKLSTFAKTPHLNWKRAPNFVAKRYMKAGVPPGAYFEDVELQMTAKALGDAYNAARPPKKVDFVQTAVLVLTERGGSPHYGVEQLIEGDYIKYNSNSGFVQAGEDGELMRHTPQAFSHFTFEHTKGKMLCCDIQGVGDLYTDPQLHTLDGCAFGSGNLGLRGFALFFRTHECNPLCTSLGLRSFERCATDVAAQGYTSSSSGSSVAPAARWGGATVSRSFLRNHSMAARLEAVRRRNAQDARVPSLEQRLKQLQAVPMVPFPTAAVHYEIARLYSEVVLLPEIRPAEDPAACRAGGIFHLWTSAAEGCIVAQVVLARAHAGLDPSQPQLAALIKAGCHAGDWEPADQLAWRYVQLAAERGVRGAAAALALGYATGEGLAAEVLEEAQPERAVWWLQRLLLACPGEASETGDTSGGGGTEAGGGAVAAAAAAPPLPAWALRCDAAAPPPLPVPDTLMGLLAEEEAEALPGASACRHELLALLGDALLAMAPEPGAGAPSAAQAAPPAADAAAAAAAFTAAAEAAEAAFKGKLAARYYARAAEVEGMA